MEASEQSYPSLLLCSATIAAASIASILLIAFKERRPTSDYDYDDDDDSQLLLWKPRRRPPLFHPYFILAFRSFVFIYCSAILIADVYANGFDVFYFYTQWSFLLLIIYFGLATISSAQGVSRSRLSSISSVPGSIEGFLKDFYKHGGNVDVENKDDAVATLQMYWETVFVDSEDQASFFFKFLLQIIFQTLGGAVVLTDIVYWLGIFPLLKDIPRSYDFLEINLHGMNVVFFLADALLNRMEFPWFRGAYFALYSCIYVLFQWSVHALGIIQWWPYPFLDPTERYAPLCYLILAVAHLVCYGLICGIRSVSRRILNCFSS